MKSKGFTLIELLVTIAIIAILAAIGITSYASATVTARNSRRVADIAQIQSALEMYREDHQKYPTNAEFVNENSELVIYFTKREIPTDPKQLQYIYDSPDVDGNLTYKLTYTLEKNGSIVTEMVHNP